MVVGPRREAWPFTLMSQLPQRNSLVSQTADILLAEIFRGTWRDWLPGERALCEKLQISRNTLRSALKQLKRDKVIQAQHGAGNRILSRPKGRPINKELMTVGLLTPEPLERLRPLHTLWIDELRGLLIEQGCRLHLYHGHQYFRQTPGTALQKLVRQNRHGCWILSLSNEPMQRWFEKNEVPCLVAGSIYPGVTLPFRDLNHRAMCRHAAGVLLALGHRRVAMLMNKSNRAGDLESETGFIDGMRHTVHAGVEPQVIRHEATIASLCHALSRLMEQKQPPTALLVVNPFHYLTVSSRLTQQGWRIPRDISVMSRDEDPFLSFVIPEPARYVTSPHLFARGLLRPVLELLRGHLPSEKSSMIIPKFIKGDSLGPPPGAAETSG
jgi:DNA-binding LacI/PurR family transcriptional regulator